MHHLVLNADKQNLYAREKAVFVGTVLQQARSESRMKWMKLFSHSKNGAGTAKDRLQIVIAQQRSGSAYPDYMPILRQEIIALIANHAHVDSDAIQVDLQCKDNNAFLELNVALPITSAT